MPSNPLHKEPVTFGISLPNRAALFGVPASDLLRTAEEAEATGYFDSVWVGDNYLSKPRLEAVSLLSAVAARTSKVKLGTICLASFNLRNPLELAIHWGTLDVISEGRTILVVCNGGSANDGPQFANEWANFERDSKERVPRLIEGVEVLRKLWGPGPVSHAGRFYHYEHVDALPKPAQARVPIPIAVNPRRRPDWTERDYANEDRILRRVARIADGWQCDGISPELLRERWSRIQEYAEQYGRAGEVSHISLHLMVNINDDEQAAYRESVEFLEHYYGAGTISPEHLELWLAYGPPEKVAAKIAGYIEAGCTTPVLRFTAHNQLAQLARCASDVMPGLRAAYQS